VNPILLIHGIDDTDRLFRHMIPWLQSKGLPVHSLNLIPNNGDAGIDELANQIAVFVGTAVPANRLIDLVGFSMGGLVARYYLQRLGGLERVQRFITISSPHHGTLTAFLRGNPGARQMRPGSDFLKDLNRDATALDRIQFTTIRTPFDLMIIPSRSSELAAARSIRVNVAVHPLMVRDRRVLEWVHRLLVAEPEATATRKA
jgi:triacylglycerol lipase